MKTFPVVFYIIPFLLMAGLSISRLIQRRRARNADSVSLKIPDDGWSVAGDEGKGVKAFLNSYSEQSSMSPPSFSKPKPPFPSGRSGESSKPPAAPLSGISRVQTLPRMRQAVVWKEILDAPRGLKGWKDL